MDRAFQRAGHPIPEVPQTICVIPMGCVGKDHRQRCWSVGRIAPEISVSWLIDGDIVVMHSSVTTTQPADGETDSVDPGRGVGVIRIIAVAAYLESHTAMIFSVTFGVYLCKFSIVLVVSVSVWMLM